MRHHFLIPLNSIISSLANAQGDRAHDPSTRGIGYQIIGCGTHGPTVVDGLTDLMTTLRKVEVDLGSSIASPAFTTFFKSIVNRQYVRDVLRNITKAAPVPDFTPLEDQTPPFICVDGPGQAWFEFPTGESAGGSVGLQDPYTTCIETGVEQIYIKSVEGLQVQFQPFMILCPNFFKLPTIPSLSRFNCLHVDPHFNRFVETGERLDSYQMWTLFQGLLQAHIESAQYDLMNADDCWRLSASEAVTSISNWIYYAASVRLGCTHFPRVRTPSFNSAPVGPPATGGRGVELLEVDPSDVTAIANKSNWTTNGTSLGAEQARLANSIEIHVQNVTFTNNISKNL